METSFLSPKDCGPSNLNRLESTLQSVALVEIQAEPTRFERWVFDERCEASYVDRGVVTVWKSARDNPQVCAAIEAVERDDGKPLTTLRLIQFCQEAVANASILIDTSSMPTRNGMIFFKDIKESDLNRTAPLSIEFSRDGTRVPVPEHLEVNRIVTMDRKVLDEYQVSALQRLNKDADKKFLLDQTLSEWSRVGNDAFHFLATLRSGVTRLNLSDKGAGSYQNSKMIRGTIMDEESTYCDAENLAYFESGLSKMGFTQNLVDEVNANPDEFFSRLHWGKKTGLMISYCMAHRDITETNHTRRRAYVDMATALAAFIRAMHGDDVCTKLKSRNVRQLVDLNHPDYTYFRKEVFDHWRNKGLATSHPLFGAKGLTFEEVDNDIGKPTVTQGCYGAGGESVARTHCGLNHRDEIHEVDNDNYDVIEWLKAQKQKGVTLPDIVAKYVPSLVDASDAEKFEAMKTLSESMVYSMRAKQKVVDLYINTCMAYWQHVVGEDGLGTPPTVTSPLGYEFDFSAYRRNPDEWTRVAKHLGLGSFCSFDQGLLVNRFEHITGGTHVPPLLIHLWEATWMDVFILLCWNECQFALNPVFDGAGVPIGKLKDANRMSIRAWNIVQAYPTPFEQWGLPGRKAPSFLDEEDSRILALE